MKQRIFIVWASGNVWRELIKQILEKDTKENHLNPSEIIWIANSSKYIFDSRGLDLAMLISISKSRENAVNLFKEHGSTLEKLGDLVDIVRNEGLNWEIVFVDVTAWKEELLKFHKKVILESSNFLVTANKNPIWLYSMEDFSKLNSYTWRYDTNTTVMWWAGVLNFVKKRVDGIKDNVLKIEWIFSGTLWYILSELEKKEQSFSEIVKWAKEQGYTEPNPWDDLNWLDVARKLIILARYAWHNVDISDVDISPVIDEKYSQFVWWDFLEKLKDEDVLFENYLNEALLEWKVLRYVWELFFDDNNKLVLKVGIKKIDKNSDLWNLSWTSNIAIVETEILKNPMPHIIKSRWAGLEVTAWAVRVWISEMLAHDVVNYK